MRNSMGVRIPDGSGRYGVHAGEELVHLLRAEGLSLSEISFELMAAYDCLCQALHEASTMRQCDQKLYDLALNYHAQSLCQADLI